MDAAGSTRPIESAARPRRRWLWLLGGVPLIMVLLVAAAPYILACAPFRDLALGLALSEANGTVTLNANVMSPSGEPLQDAVVMVQVVMPSGKTESVRLTPVGDEWGLFNGVFTPTEPGKYQLTLSCRENQSTLETSFTVHGTTLERLGQPARLDVLEEITSISHGRMANAGSLNDLLSEISALPEPDPLSRRLRLWCHPVWGGFLVFMLGIFWVGRKMIGTI